ncbi:dihydrofolate reductase family protein [Phycicoccus sp. MAQZ13P-2]|uniref:dihydrofolate reductase family protein n=1 Tax=Phycicoccus mangrovi TaxID=2840470 RepID=UPI001C0036F2|nr:dihydrofolate reductase family protein [Phycicoccus mangrovi]MBT9255670.1 dihydrofolate reductase family protein [Phycicoccus mangrovi]MBT9274263.1 dihydrofolate reductase family protein [Phycicoccus mangrovi]
MSRTRVHNFSVSLDGFGSGEPQSLEAPFGHAGQRLHAWMFATRFWGPDGSSGVDDALAQQHSVGIGAEIMGSHKFGPPGWQDDPDWRGWWGEDPPFHTPTFVLTHRPRPPLEMAGGTTFHFLDAPVAEALEVAREAAGGLDVRVGGGATVVRDFLAAGLVDHAHVVQVPILLGRGVRLWDGLEALEDTYAIDAVASPSGVVHLLLDRRD